MIGNLARKQVLGYNNRIMYEEKKNSFISRKFCSFRGGGGFDWSTLEPLRKYKKNKNKKTPRKQRET